MKPRVFIKYYSELFPLLYIHYAVFDRMYGRIAALSPVLSVFIDPPNIQCQIKSNADPNLTRKAFGHSEISLC